MVPMTSTAPVAERSEWPGDERAVTRFLAGDVTGFEQIVRHYSSMVFCLASRLVGVSEAEDVVQETFLRAYRGLESFRGEASLKTWLYAIALNRVRARHGALVRMRELFASKKVTQDDELDRTIEEAPDPSATPEENALTAERRRRLREAIRALPEEFKNAVILRDLEGLSYQEVAEVLCVPVGTVRSRIARGRALLSERLT